MISNCILNKMNNDELKAYIERKKNLKEKYDNVICANEALIKKFKELYNAQDFKNDKCCELKDAKLKLSDFEILMETKYDSEIKDITRE